MNNKHFIEKAAFFDVDGTIISTKSLISFAHYLTSQGEGDLKIPSMPIFLSVLSKKYNLDIPRHELNRYYFSIYKGIEKKLVDEAAQSWFHTSEQVDGFYIQSSLNEIKRFKSKGYKVVLVSGSFLPLLLPMKEKIGFDDILCTIPECVNGKYTGELIGTPCIGSNKKDAILKYAIYNNIDLKDCWAFGDDDSDIPMLNTVGNGVRVSAVTDDHPSVMSVFE